MESETFEVMSLKGHTLNNTYENVKDVLEKNARYKKLLQVHVNLIFTLSYNIMSLKCVCQMSSSK